MIPLMIKINLLPSKEIKRRRRSGPSVSVGGGSNIAALFMLVIVMEVGGLMYWYMQAEEAAATQSSTGNNVGDEKNKLEKLKTDLAELEKLEKQVGKQRVVFSALDNQKKGPIDLLLFISYALRRVDANMDEDEYRVLSDVWEPSGAKGGFAVGDGEEVWNPDTVWLTGISEQEMAMTISGQAKEHEHVMTFLRRLQSGIYFEGVDLVEQKVKTKSPLGQSYVEFKLRCEVNFDPKEYPAL